MVSKTVVLEAWHDRMSIKILIKGSLFSILFQLYFQGVLKRKNLQQVQIFYRVELNYSKQFYSAATILTALRATSLSRQLASFSSARV